MKANCFDVRAGQRQAGFHDSASCTDVAPLWPGRRERVRARDTAATQNVDRRAEMLVEEGGGTQHANRLSEMRCTTYTVVQKMFLEKGGGAQNVNRSSEIRFHQHRTRTVHRKCGAKRGPLCRKCSCKRVAGHKTRTVQRKHDAKPIPLRRKCFWNRVAEHKTLTV